MIETDNFAKVEVTSAARLREWLAANHAQQAAVWLVTCKRHVEGKYVSVAEMLDELLCFGWIDGVRRKLDADRTMQLISPRRVQHWAKSYKDRAARLIEAGRMEAPGLAAIAASKQAGLWTEMEDVDAMAMPDDLVAALAALPMAAENFAAFSQSSRRNVLRWIKIAKTSTTREKRIALTATLAARGEKVPQM